MGTKITPAEIAAIFNRLNFKAEINSDELTVDVPARRWDISIPADLVEEVGRLYGYDNIKSTQPVLAETHGGYSKTEETIRHIKDIVRGQGLIEAISYSLTSPEKAIAFTKEPKKLVKVQMPLNSSRSTLRQNLMTGLVDAASYNMARKQNQLAIFEQGRVYDYENDTYNEHEHLATLYTGNAFFENWQHDNEKIDFFFVKGQLTNLFLAMGIDLNDIEYKAEIIMAMHPTRTAGIYIKGNYVGMIGMIGRPVTETSKTMKGSEIYGYELDLDTIVPMILNPQTTAQTAPKFPAVERDLSILVDQDTTNQAVEAVIKENGGKYLHDLRIIDVYRGSHIADDKKSFAYRLTFLNENETLTDAVVNEAMNSIDSSLTKLLKAEIR